MGNHHTNKGELKMARPKKTTEAGKIATERWRQTMIKKYGSVTEKMRETGRIGGQNGKGPDYTGGFAGDRERAKIAGAKGGTISRRTSKYHSIFEENKAKIEETLKNSYTMKDLAQELGVPYTSLLHYVDKYIYNK